MTRVCLPYLPTHTKSCRFFSNVRPPPFIATCSPWLSHCACKPCPLFSPYKWGCRCRCPLEVCDFEKKNKLSRRRRKRGGRWRVRTREDASTAGVSYARPTTLTLRCSFVAQPAGQIRAEKFQFTQAPVPEMGLPFMHAGQLDRLFCDTHRFERTSGKIVKTRVAFLKGHDPHHAGSLNTSKALCIFCCAASLLVSHARDGR